MWKKRILKSGEIKFTEGQKWIRTHKQGNLYWTDYGMKDGHVLGTLMPARSLRQASMSVEHAKKEFVSSKRKKLRRMS